MRTETKCISWRAASTATQNLNSIISGDKNFAFESNESFEKHGFTRQEFDDESEELVNSEVDEDTDMVAEDVFSDDMMDEDM